MTPPTSPSDSPQKPIRTLSMGVGVQTCYLLFKFPERYNYIIHCDIANGDRTHGEGEITYWILDNLVKPFCEKNNLPLIILTHKDGGLWQRSIDKEWLPMMYPRWCTQDHKVELIRRYIRKELKANFPDNIVHSDIGFSYDEVLRINPNRTRTFKYIVEDYPLVDLKIKRQECINWLNKNYPIKVDWKDAKSGCWFCPFWKKEKLLQLNDWQKQEMITLERNTKNGIKWKVTKPFDEYLNMNIEKLDGYMEDESCTSGHCFV